MNLEKIRGCAKHSEILSKNMHAALAQDCVQLLKLTHKSGNM